MQFFLHQCPVPKTSSVNAAIIAARALTEALTNPAPAALFYQFVDAQQQVIVDLDETFQRAIANQALPIFVPLQPAALTAPPPPSRVTIPVVPPRVKILPVPPRVTIPPVLLRVTIPSVPPKVTITPVPLRVPSPVQPNFIKPDYNGDNVDTVAVPRYRLRSQRQKQSLAEQETHYIAANTSAISHPPHFLLGAGSRFARATRNLIATNQQRTNHAKNVIDMVTGPSL